MKIKCRIMIPVMAGIILNSFSSAVCQFSDHNQMTKKLQDLGRQYPGLCTVQSIARTNGSKDLWLVRIGTGAADERPGIAVVGGVDGRYIFSRELAAGMAEYLLKNSNEEGVKELLGKITFYIFPDVSPDASAQYFSGLKYERNLNSVSTDDDRDFQQDEDPFEDISKDGLITQMRIADPAGTYIESDEDGRLMIPADLSKGQSGRYLVYSEGIDNDKDGKFNEDGPGGVSFNRNFTFNYEEFGLNAGLYPVSETETRAMADFLYDRFNIYMVLTFGPQDNLGQPMRSQERPQASQAPAQNQPPDQGMMRRERGRITSILRTDETINKLVSDKFHEITGLKGNPAAVSDPGNFMEWAYYHYGRYSFSTPGWWINAEKGKSTEASFLRMAEKNNTDAFIPWKAVTHPDFPGKTCEVGGISPFAMLIPPRDTVNHLIEVHYKFLTALAAMHPELEFLDVKTEDAGENIFRLTLKVHNKGIFATGTEVGEQNIWTRIMRLTLEPAKGQTILSGEKVQRIQRLQGDETAEFSWLVSGKGRMLVTAGSVNTGKLTASIELK